MSDSLFKPATSYAAGKIPAAVAVADVNGDRKPDLVVANRDDGTVSVLRGDGRGGFGPAASYSAGSSPVAVAVADLDGTGGPDLVVGDQYGGLNVLLNDGSGGFSAAAAYAPDSRPVSVAVADVDGDGSPDLVGLDSNDGVVEVLRGDGHGGFSAPVSYSVGFIPTSVTAADLNGDQRPDLVVTDLFDGVYVLLNDGSGGFAEPTAYATSFGPLSAAVADVNKDGHPDLVVANSGGGDVDVLLGDGSGGFSDAVGTPAGQGPVSVAVADVDGDGNPDLVVADLGNNGEGSVSVLLGDGSGGFSVAASYAVGGYPDSVAVADVNGDGRPDLAVANQFNGAPDRPITDESGGVYVLLNDAACFLPGTLIRTPAGERPIEDLRIGDAVSLASGGTAPIRWVARQTIATRFADPLRTQPVRVRAGALGENVPARDLLLSPDHALFLDGVLVQAGALVNGSSIVRETAMPERFTYYNLELAEHALIWAEGTVAETFVDNIGRGAFDNAAEHAALYPDAPWIEEMPVPRAKSARQVPAALRRCLDARAAATGATGLAEVA